MIMRDLFPILSIITDLKGMNYLMTISRYIRTHKELSKYDFMTVYSVVIELIKDKKMEWQGEDV